MNYTIGGYSITNNCNCYSFRDHYPDAIACPCVCHISNPKFSSSAPPCSCKDELKNYLPRKDYLMDLEVDRKICAENCRLIMELTERIDKVEKEQSAILSLSDLAVRYIAHAESLKKHNERIEKLDDRITLIDKNCDDACAENGQAILELTKRHDTLNEHVTFKCAKRVNTDKSNNLIIDNMSLNCPNCYQHLKIDISKVKQ